ncbi:GFA family protein [Salinisphaera sp. RV14]|uniref:GFA family protein n=1 Tax=unclassified Salinisphaera TaxID=2649847 RepID=UPI003F8640AB
MTKPHASGRCLCGSVHYRITQAPVHTFYCHCTDCQKETGGPFAAEIYVPADSVSCTGHMKEYVVTGDSGRPVRRFSCATCASPILTVFDDEPRFVCVKACSLDEASGLQPEFHLYVKSKQPWYVIADGLPQYPGDMEW